ncbi:MAG: AbrB/MazE/SpoVT family DNA-binding domain-containing protein [Candidatus Brocadiaceae bacterium]|nr:AbrB/MazE/SpoVT family DNA-binding domain-containing protein [Candidatus Brocadiaceae bacterium]
MKVKLVPIGNSKGVRIPAAILKQCNINNEVNFEVEKGRIIITSTKSRPREGWDKAFRLMHTSKDDALLIDETVGVESDDWEWK